MRLIPPADYLCFMPLSQCDMVGRWGSLEPPQLSMCEGSGMKIYAARAPLVSDPEEV